MKSTPLNKQILVFLVMVFIMTGCGKGTLFQKNTQVDRDGWSYGDGLEYAFEVTDTISQYDLYLDIKHDRSFSYQNLYLNLKTNFPKSQPVLQQLSIELMDNFGSWEGTCKGNDCNRKVLIKEDFNFSETGSYSIEINQWSREPLLAGIVSVGLLIEKSLT